MIESGKLYRIKGNSDYFRDKYGIPNPIIKIEAEDIQLWEGGWKQSGVAACVIYGWRNGVELLPVSGKVFYGHIEGCGLGELVHESELEPYHGPTVEPYLPNVTFENSDPGLWDD